MAAEKNYIPAITALMYQYSDMGEFGANPEKELYWTRKGCELGDVSSMLKLANEYALGEIVEKDEDEEEKWLQKAASKGSAEAYNKMAFLMKYFQDKDKQIQFRRRAISLSEQFNDRDAYESACYGLGYAYKPLPNNPNADPVKSAYFFALSYILGNEGALALSKESGYQATQEEFKLWVEDAKNLKVRM